MKNVIQNHRYIFYITLCLTLICWIFVFMQLIRNHLPAITHRAIPAFQSIETANFQNPPDGKTIYNMLKEYDSDIRLISSHKEKNYTDLYFYSPVIRAADKKNTTRNFNLQVAITKKQVYFGIPMLHYDF